MMFRLTVLKQQSLAVMGVTIMVMGCTGSVPARYVDPATKSSSTDNTTSTVTPQGSITTSSATASSPASTTSMQQNSSPVVTTGAFNTKGWVATDALGRSLPTPSEAGPLKSDKIVGMFYYLWHDSGWTYYYWADVTKMIASDPQDPSQYNPSIQQPTNWYWAEPQVGYYRTDDPWVLRRHLTMLAIAGVDFLFFDGSNSVAYVDAVKTLCTVAATVAGQGLNPPKVSWLANGGALDEIKDIYNNFYKPGTCKDFWFEWQGKPLLMLTDDSLVATLPAEIKNFFTIRISWAWMDDSTAGNWGWLDNYPQRYGWSVNPSTPEQIPVAKGSHASNNHGVSFHDGAQPAIDDHYVTPDTPKGLNFAEQWSRALKVNPQVVMVTQWNEWIGGCYGSVNGGDQFLFQTIAAGQCNFVDEFNMEYSRDLEPMREGYTDNYYYQLVSYIRKFKGMPANDPVSAATTINISTDFTPWNKIQPVFMNPQGDITHRDWDSVMWTDASQTQRVRYTNNTGRNDIVQARVTYDASQIYCYVKVNGTLSPKTDPAWMQLLIDVDSNTSTGWLGYDYFVNVSAGSNGAMGLQHWQNGAYKTVATNISWQQSQNEIQLAIPRSLLQMTGSPKFDFKWIDNVDITALTAATDLTPFFTDGDAAPHYRFNYRFDASGK